MSTPLRPLAALVAAIGMGLTACGGGGSATTTTTGAATTTTAAGEPVPLGTTAALELSEGQCYTAAPGPGPAAPTTTGSPGQLVLARVLVVDCSAAHEARVYGAPCLAPRPDGVLVAADCPGAPDAPWPGDRELRRTAVRLCLQRFADEFGEPYATSQRTTVELVPTSEEWAAGHRRVICGVNP